MIPILAVLPLLAIGHVQLPFPHLGSDILSWFSLSNRAILIAGAVLGIILAGRIIVRPFFHFIARTHLQELFTASALLIVIGIVLLMDRVGLDPALGAFLGGVVLADSEFRHQIEADIGPFKGLLLGIFFVAVGASIDLSYFASEPWLVSGIVIGLIAIKFVILWLLARVFGMEQRSSLLMSFALAQGDEFAFVLFPASVALGLLSPHWSSIFILSVALSMALTPFLLMIGRKIVQPRVDKPKRQGVEEVIVGKSDVLLIGFGRFGSIVGRFLKANGIPTTILDYDAEQIDALRDLGLKVYYGDASRLAILRTAGADHAKVILVTIDCEESTLRIVDHVKTHFPKAKILVRAKDRSHAYRLVKKNITHIYHEMEGTALQLSIDRRERECLGSIHAA